MRKQDPVAVLCADLHLTLRQPNCRADESWMQTQREYLMQLNALSEKHRIPVICAGDIFDRWNPQPELLNFSLRYLPEGMLCVPGQHDLPNHNIKDLYRSGYGVLVQAGKIKTLSGTKPFTVATTEAKNLLIYGFGWEEEIHAPYMAEKGVLKVAVIHQYVWRKGDSYPDAPKDQYFDKMWSKLKGYDVAVFGDNHKGFSEHKGSTLIYNCGGFIRRKSDELKYIPAVGLLYADGSVMRHKLDTSKDRFHKNSKEDPKDTVDLQSFIENLEGLGEQGLDFRAAIKHYLDAEKVDKETRKIINTALEQHDSR
jgi:DNA repair exonuclease SbcCD nuclease subunit